jgi:phosphoribosyl 1,2-cyclic phosphodiesterase
LPAPSARCTSQQGGSYTYQRKIRFHLDVATLRQQAGRLGARRIVLTHMSPDLLSRVGEVGWETARDGMTVELEG